MAQSGVLSGQQNSVLPLDGWLSTDHHSLLLLILPSQAELEATRAQKLAAETELGAQRAAGRQRAQALQVEVARLEGQVGAAGSGTGMSGRVDLDLDPRHRPGGQSSRHLMPSAPDCGSRALPMPLLLTVEGGRGRRGT